MKVSAVREWMDRNLRTDEEEVVAIFLRGEEIRQATGPNYPHMERLTRMLSRIPNGYDLTGNYWWDKRHIFHDLVVDAMEYIEKDLERERIHTANDELAKELGLENIIFSVDHEVRPMKVFSEQPVTVEVFTTGKKFKLKAKSRWLDFLRELDKANENCGDHRFFESISLDKESGNLQVWFGS